MRIRRGILPALSVFVVVMVNGQDLKQKMMSGSVPVKTSGTDRPQGFFLNGWSPRTISNPSYNDIPMTTDPVTVSFTVDFTDTLAKISPYLFGDNANLWTGQMSNNPGLMKHISDRHMGVLRGPGGSTSDVFFWNATKTVTTPDSVPSALYGSTGTDWPWYGHMPKNWDNSWTMDVDSFYSILGHVDATGIITVNYGYARYGTSKYPVRKAAHLAAQWVRYDKGRSKFWEIGNEVFGSWEAGYQINTSSNRDGQPAVINPTLYGQHCSVFIDSMKAAAAKIGVDIKIGVVMLDSYSSAFPYWNRDVAAAVGSKADFYIVHSYYTPYNENSTIATILNSAANTPNWKNFVLQQLDLAGKPHLPVAMTEYNTFSIGSKQAISHINGMHAVLITGEAIKSGYGLACRWDLANGYNNGDDMGMYSYGDPYVPDYTPYPPFYHMYFLRRFSGDVLLNSTQVGITGVTIIPTAFSSGQVGVTFVNKTSTSKVIRLNIKNFKFGDRYYTYTLTGETGITFSNKVYVNSIGPSLYSGGPGNYESIAANSSLIENEIRIMLPAYSSTFVLVEPGTRDLQVNNQVTAVSKTCATEAIGIYPNPATDSFTLTNLTDDISSFEIKDISGMVLYRDSSIKGMEEKTVNIDLKPGIYFVCLYGDATPVTKKLIIR